MLLKNCDLCVAGGGIAGMCAAIAAARKGLRVILINDRSVLGGNASSEISVNICGSSHHGLNPAIYAKETGIVNEIRLRMDYYRDFGGYGEGALCDAVFFDVIYNEENIELLPNTVVDNCETKDGRITKLFARHSVNNNYYEIVAPNYVDATGNGTLGLLSGAKFRIGRESKDEFGEFWAQDKPDSHTMGHSLLFETEDTDHEVIFKAPDYAHDISKLEFIKHLDNPKNFRQINDKGFEWTYEYGGQVDILEDHDDIELELRKLTYGIWDYVKNSGKFPDAKNRKLKRVYAKAGSRESRRFIGDYILTENDIENKVNFPDSVAMGGWPMDVHATEGIYDTAPASNFIPVTGTYNIPFRCLYSKDISNLMMPGRNISVTHVALGSTRVMATCGSLGQAVGTAAYLAKKYSKTPQEIYLDHIDELKTILLEDDQSIVHSHLTPLAATAYADSCKEYENTAFDSYMPLDRDYALSLACDSQSLDSVKVKIKALADTTLKVKVLSGTHPETYLPEKLEKDIEVDIKKSFEDWLNVPLNSAVGKDGKVYIVFTQNSSLEIATGKTRTMGAVTLRMHHKGSCEGYNHDSVPATIDGTDYFAFDHHYEKERNILFCDALPRQGVFDAQNVLNGYNRPYKTPNIWIPKNALPQTLTVVCDSPTDISSLSITFDDRLDLDNKESLPKTIAKEYDIKIYHKNGWDSISEKENYQRFVRYDAKFEGVSKIKITINKTYGEECGIYGVYYK